MEGDQAEKSVEMIHGAPVYRLRGRLLPLVNLKHELKVEGQTARLCGSCFITCAIFSTIAAVLSGAGASQ